MKSYCFCKTDHETPAVNWPIGGVVLDAGYIIILKYIQVFKNILPVYEQVNSIVH